ncbi:MAG: PD-(D/E)XK nuclease family transposase [Planctomycetales bacterium]
MAIGIDPTVDFAFKMLFGNPAFKAITIHFINAVLDGSPRIVDVTIFDLPRCSREMRSYFAWVMPSMHKPQEFWK